MPQSRGSALLQRVKYLRSHFPKEWDGFVQQLSPSTQELVKGLILEGVWYPFDAFVEINVLADKMFGKGDFALVHEMGRYAASANLSTLLKLFLRFGSPEFILGKGASLWSLHHDSGRAEANVIGPGRGTYEILEFATPHRALCQAVHGWIVGALEVTGVRGIDVKETRCAVQGQGSCLFELRWAA